jgi:superfamily I DNA/RNA helicase
MMEENPMKINVVVLKTYIVNGKQVDEWGDGKLQWKGVFIIHEDAEKQLNAVLTLLKYSCLNKKIKWTYKNAFEDRFAKVKYNHAITVHKSQGSTYKQAILNVGNINRNPSQKEKTRLFYTGITRASDLLILYNV